MGLRLNIVSAYVRKRLARLPACVRDIAISWHKNLGSRIDEGDTYPYVKDSIGLRTDTIYYGQYLNATSGQINFYRTSGTFDYTDPSDGSSITGVSIPGTGLYTIPANGICDIITSDGSEYPVCERAGTVLHDVKETGVHISVATPSWSESLYGSDYLNQQGFVTKAESDALGYDWETVVNTTPISLNDNTLIPLGQWDYQPLLDLEGDPVTDSEGDPIYTKENL